MEKLFMIIGMVAVAMLAVAGLALIKGTIVWLIWPHVAVAVFGLPVLTWWKAVLLSWLCGLLFGGSKGSINTKED